MPPSFRPIRKTEVPQACRGPWRTVPIVRLDRRGQVYFSKYAAVAFSDRRLVAVDFDDEARLLRFTAVDAPPDGMSEDDLFRLTPAGPSANDGCSLAARSLLRHLGFHMNGGQELAIAHLDQAGHSISVVLPAAQFAM